MAIKASDKREKVLDTLKVAETEEGRTGLVADYVANNPETAKENKKKK